MSNGQLVEARYMRNCGYMCVKCRHIFKNKGVCPECGGKTIKRVSHPADQTLELKNLNDVISVYCLGCLIESVGLKPIEKLKLKIRGDNVELVQIPLDGEK